MSKNSNCNVSFVGLETTTKKHVYGKNMGKPEFERDAIPTHTIKDLIDIAACAQFAAFFQI